MEVTKALAALQRFTQKQYRNRDSRRASGPWGRPQHENTQALTTPTVKVERADARS